MFEGLGDVSFRALGVFQRGRMSYVLIPFERIFGRAILFAVFGEVLDEGWEDGFKVLQRGGVGPGL